MKVSKDLTEGIFICIVVRNISYVFLHLLGETLVNVLDFKKDMGLWHGVLTVSLRGRVWVQYSQVQAFALSLDV